MLSTSRTQSSDKDTKAAWFQFSDKEDTKAACFQRQEHSPVIRTLRLHGFNVKNSPVIRRTLRLHGFNDKNTVQ